jgi:hypothetical protein
MKEISRPSEFRLWHGYCWLILTRFIIRIGNKKKNRLEKPFSFSWFLKRLADKGKEEDEEGEEKRKEEGQPSSLYQDDRKDALRLSLESARPQPSQAQGCKSVNSFKKLSLDKKALPWDSIAKGHLESCFPRIHFTMFSSPDTQSFCNHGPSRPTYCSR